MLKGKNSLNEQCNVHTQCMMIASGALLINFKGSNASQKIVSDNTEMRGKKKNPKQSGHNLQSNIHTEIRIYRSCVLIISFWYAGCLKELLQSRLTNIYLAKSFNNKQNSLSCKCYDKIQF